MGKNKVKMTLEFAFDHTKENIFEACGVNEDKAIQFLTNDFYNFVITQKCISESEVAEWSIRNMTPDYLALILLRDIRENMQTLEEIKICKSLQAKGFKNEKKNQ